MGPPPGPPAEQQTVLTAAWQEVEVEVRVGVSAGTGGGQPRGAAAGGVTAEHAHAHGGAPVQMWNCSAVNVSCAKIPLQIWARVPFRTGAQIGIDDISIFKVQ